MSKVSTMSRMSMFGSNRKASLTQVKNDVKSTAKLTAFLESSPKPKDKVPGISRKKLDPIIEAMGGLQVTVNPITGHTQQFAKALNNGADQTRNDSLDVDRQDLIDFAPIQVKDVGLSKIHKRQKEPEGGFVIP